MHEPSGLTELAPLALLYHENSKISHATLAHVSETIGEFASDVDQLRRTTTAAKTYPGGERIEFSLLAPLPRPKRSLDEVLEHRRSVRSYEPRAIELQTVASLLHFACGSTGELVHPDHPEIRQPLRAHPSAGALFPIETYLVAARVEGLVAGIYHYHAIHHCLELVRRDDVAARINSLILLSPAQHDAPATLILSARWESLIVKYGERSYRLAAIDAGHVAQNLLLVATALGLASCPIAGFHDDSLAAELGLDPLKEPPLYVITIGQPCSSSP